jgi:hypothetical protein
VDEEGKMVNKKWGYCNIAEDHSTCVRDGDTDEDNGDEKDGDEKDSDDEDSSLSNGVKWEVWDGIEGSDIASLTSSPKYTGPATESTTITTGSLGFGSSSAIAKMPNSGSRLSAVFTASESGDFVFHIASDGAAQLWLTTEADRDAWEVASVPSGGYCVAGAHGEFGKYPHQSSRPVRLEKGHEYPLRVLHKSDAYVDAARYVDVRLQKLVADKHVTEQMEDAVNGNGRAASNLLQPISKYGSLGFHSS